MLSNYYTLSAVASDLNARLRGVVIGEAYTQERNELVTTFRGQPGGLVISCQPEANTLYFHPSFTRSRKNSTNVLDEVAGKDILSVSMSPSDRVVQFSLIGGLSMYACFFGPKANVLVVDPDNMVIDAFKKSRTAEHRLYEPSTGKIVHDISGLRTIVAANPRERLFTLLKNALPSLGSTLAREVLFRAGIQDTLPAEQVTDLQLDRLEQASAAVLAELAVPVLRVYLSEDPHPVPYCFSLIRLEHCQDRGERIFGDIHDALRFYLLSAKSARSIRSRSGSMLDQLQQRKAKLERTVAAIEADLRDTARADEYESHANLLMSNLSAIPRGATSVALSQRGETATIPLDARLSPVQNAQRYFEKAKRSRVAYEQSRTRLPGMQESLNVLERLIAAAGLIQTPGELKGFLVQYARELESLDMGEKAEKRERLPFRIFLVDGGYEVWAGKSSHNNDELTLRYAKPNDLWFHARGGSGSHVVLKTDSGKGEPSKKAREQAAGIAAYYSKMRNAKMVPVAMTERKYVRKPKGVPPGTVVLDREKVLFAEPGLPR